MRNYGLALRTLPKRIWIAVRSLARLMGAHPGYAWFAGAAALLFYEVIFWALNLNLLQYLLTSRFLTVTGKIQLLLGSFSGIFSPPLSALSVLLLGISALQGLTVAVLLYLIRRARSLQRDVVTKFGAAGAAGALAALGLGCAACGTSLITPILTFFFATSSAALSEQVGLYAAALSLAVSLVTLYLASLKLTAYV